MTRVLLVVALTACGETEPVMAPVIDVPIDDSDALAMSLDEITLAIAHADNDRDLVTARFERGAPIEVPGVPFGDDLVLHMTGLIGASTVAYGRSCVVAVAPGVEPPVPHLFFSRLVKFANLGIAPVQRIGGFGVGYLGNGLLIGGRDGSGAPVSTVERFDALTGQLIPVGDLAPRAGAVQALVGTSPPRVIVVGGFDGGDGARFVELVDDTHVEQHESEAMARVDLTATALTDGRVIVIGGNAPAGPPSVDVDMVAVVDGATPEVRKLAATLARPRARHSATRIGDDVGAPVLLIGGIDDTGAAIDGIELFKPLSEELADTAALPQKLNIPRHGHVATLMPDNSVLVIGGVDADSRPVRMLELFSFDTGFVPVGDLPMAAGVVELTATTLPDGRILITGGRAMPGGPPLNSAYIARLDPLDGRVDVVATDRLAVARAGHQAMVLCDGTVLISGGTDAQAPAERYNPPPLGRR